MAILRLTLIGVYNYDTALFAGLPQMSGIDLEMFRDNLLFKYGECGVVHADPAFLKKAVKLWGEKWATSFEKMAAALNENYNALHNFDRHEEWTDRETGSESTSTNSTDSKTGTDTDTSKVSAMNVSTFQNDTQLETAYGSVDTGAYDSEGSTERDMTHTGHLFGNIGVTTSQEMLLAELKLRMDNNLYDIMAEVFRREFLLYLW